MGDEISDKEGAIEIVKGFAEDDRRCVGEFGEIIDVHRDENSWIVEFRTHTLSEEHTHQIRITTAVGNVVSYDRTSKFD